MREFIDKTPTQNGTPINRNFLMAIQGFDTSTIEFAADSIIETNSLGETKTTKFLENGAIEESFKGKFILNKRTEFSDSQIKEVIY